jgi:lipopolysaccharide/colanic/teichoic acid biosynthesis glycosyltransferase
VSEVAQAGSPAQAQRTTAVAAPRDQRRAWPAVKRGLDIAISLAVLLVLAPVLAVIAVAIKLDSPGPVLFRQRRLGRNMAPFTMLKFRTMHPEVPSDPHARYIAALAGGNGNGNGNGLKKLTADPRVTRVGRVLRRLSIDELPQLLNVLADGMSLIGPRPALPYELEHYQARHYDRFAVRPGLSGLWQVSGRNRLGFMKMLDLDAEYARTSGPLMDTRILLRTPVAMVRDCA